MVETSQFSDRMSDRWAAYWRAPRPTLHLVERFRRVDAQTVDYRFTVTDPTMFTQPWTAVAPFSGDQEARGATVGTLFEYACHEGNYAVPNVLAGARAKDKARSHQLAVGSNPTEECQTPWHSSPLPHHTRRRSGGVRPSGKPCFASGSERIRVPVLAKIALQTAGRIGGSVGSPSPVGGLSVVRKVRLDLGWRLRESNHRELVEVALHGATSFEGDLLRHELTQTIDDRTLHLGTRAGGIDDLPTDVYRRPDNDEVSIRDLAYMVKTALGSTSEIQFRALLEGLRLAV